MSQRERGWDRLVATQRSDRICARRVARHVAPEARVACNGEGKHRRRSGRGQRAHVGSPVSLMRIVRITEDWEVIGR
jgi:hypothetical protein